MQTIKFDNQEIKPSKVVCIGRNYVDHITELGNEVPTNMIIFNKTNCSISNELIFISEDTRYEGEICFLIKDKKIAALGFGLDLTKANLQNELKKKGLPWERAKSFKGSAVLSDFVSFDGDIKKISFEMFINDELKQKASYDLMMYKPSDMLSEIEGFMDLYDGDIIMSGTPKGVGTYKKDDKFYAKVYCDEKLLLDVTWIVK